MADVPLQDPQAATSLMAVMDAAGALRRGEIVAVFDDAGVGRPSLLVLAAETASLDMLAELSVFGPLTVVLSASRMGAPGAAADGIVAVGLPPPWDLPGLRALADPVLPQPTYVPQAVMVPAEADAVLALLKRARLLPAAVVVATQHDPAGPFPTVTRADILGYGVRSAACLHRVSEAPVPLAQMADCRLVTFRAGETGQDHLAILFGRPEDAAIPLVRVHSECFTGDLLGSLRCDCGAQLHGSIDRIVAEGVGAVLYLAQEGRGIGLANKLRAYTLQDRGLDTLDANRALGFAADERDFAIAGEMLRQLGLTRIRLLTNNPDKIASIGLHGIEVAARVSLRFAANGINDVYLATKTERFGHLAHEPDPA